MRTIQHLSDDKLCKKCHFLLSKRQLKVLYLPICWFWTSRKLLSVIIIIVRSRISYVRIFASCLFVAVLFLANFAFCLLTFFHASSCFCCFFFFSCCYYDGIRQAVVSIQNSTVCSNRQYDNWHAFSVSLLANITLPLLFRLDSIECIALCTCFSVVQNLTVWQLKCSSFSLSLFEMHLFLSLSLFEMFANIIIASLFRVKLLLKLWFNFLVSWYPDTRLNSFMTFQSVYSLLLLLLQLLLNIFYYKKYILRQKKVHNENGVKYIFM